MKTICTNSRVDDAILAKMNVLFDKTSDSKCPTDVKSNSIEDDTEDCKHLKKALLESISTGKIGALTVDPQYLDFEALECKL